MAHTDWLAIGHKGKRDQAQKTLSYIGKPDNRIRLEFGPTTLNGKFYDKEAIPKFDKFDAAVGIWENEDMRNKHVVKAVEDTEKDFIPAYREIYRILRGSLAVTNDDLLSMGLPPHPEGGGGHPSPVADIPPWVEILLKKLRFLVIKYGASATSSAKLEGQHGIEAVYRVGGERPTHISELTHSVFDTDSPLEIEFDEADRGKIVWFAVRWENTRGEKGPWSEIFFAIIP
jgi:hypothetical protein